MSKYKAMSTLGLGLMQFGAGMKDRELKQQQMANEALRNERLDKLAERKVVNEEAMTAANVRKADLEAIRMGIENENLDPLLKAQVQDAIASGNLKKAQGLLAGAQAGKVGAETAEVAANAASSRELQGAQAASLQEQTQQSAAIFEALGMDTAKADYMAKTLDNELKLLEAKDKGVLTEMRKAEQELKEFIAGGMRDKDGKLIVNEEVVAALKGSKEGTPTKEIQIAGSLLPMVKQMFPDGTPEQHVAASLDWATQMTQRNAVPDVIQQIIAAGSTVGDLNMEPTVKLPKLGVAGRVEEDDDDKDPLGLNR